MEQVIQYCTSSDGVRLAYSVIGKGTPIVRASHWMTHLEYDLQSPVLRHWILGLADHHALVRYDARDLGLSQRDVPNTSFDLWVDDLSSVVDAVGLDRFVLFGASQGTPISIAYAARNPERVSHLILYGGFARGFARRGDSQKQNRLLELSRLMIREGWGSDQESYRQWFTSQFLPNGTLEQFHWFNKLQQMSATPEAAERNVVVSSQIDVADLLPQIKAPTLVLHVRGDARVPFESGRELAARIPGAKFVPLEGSNHIFLADEPAHHQFMQAVAKFLGDPPPKRILPGSLTPRERLDRVVRTIEQNWAIKLAVILAALAGLIIFGMEIWKSRVR